MRATILGVYWIPTSEFCNLIELDLHGVGRFDIGAITQPDSDRPPPEWQVPYDVHRLSEDGSSGEPLEEMGAIEVSGHCRLAFFFHFLIPGRLLETPWGPIAMPPPSPRPARLGFIAYEDP